MELYQEDSLKYEAALFLIDNMGYYQGADSGELNSMYKAYEIFSTDDILTGKHWIRPRSFAESPRM